MSGFKDMTAKAQAGEHWAQRMLVGYLALAADDTDDPATILDEACHWARLAARGGEADFASMLFVLMKRGAFPGGDEAGAEAIARMEVAASSGHEECASQLLRVADDLPPDVSRRFFARAKDIVAITAEYRSPDDPGNA